MNFIKGLKNFWYDIFLALLWIYCFAESLYYGKVSQLCIAGFFCQVRVIGLIIQFKKMKPDCSEEDSK